MIDDNLNIIICLKADRIITGLLILNANVDREDQSNEFSIFITKSINHIISRAIRVNVVLITPPNRTNHSGVFFQKSLGSTNAGICFESTTKARPREAISNPRSMRS